MKNSHGLSDSELLIIRDIFITYRDKITRVGLFGSRATGKYRKNSDIDLVVYGELTEAEINRIWTLFDNSNLAYKVDIVAYDLISYPKLKNHVDEFMVTLWLQSDLHNGLSNRKLEKEKI